MPEPKDWNSVDEILDFAIEREQEAADFYEAAADQASSEWMKKIFRQYAKEELGHKAKLQNVKKGKKALSAAGKIGDLKMADSLVAVEPAGDMSYQQILVLAMKREKIAFKLYSEMAERVDDVPVRDLFLGLAQEEAKHKLRFELEYDEVILKDN
jgi:rubrerythrin